ncbi:Card1-like endonuclease domain-containing protein [Vibrio owensii]|uniref:Card1-like endonuclease domain-containing protein n=1 Tax=Vibrio owensii TaxID=696485 RepID=UPI0005ED4CE1|nr:DUF1887 family CARF protein [Vibrio owensii]
MLITDKPIDTHIGILDEEPIRLITPLLLNVGISEIFLVGDYSQKIIFERIEEILSIRNVTCFFYEITPESEPHNLIYDLKFLCEKLINQKRNIFFNASCGSRFRLLTAYEVFSEHKWPTYILELETNEICWLNNEDNSAVLKNKGSITVKEWLAVSGATIYEETQYAKNNDISSSDIALANEWAFNSVELSKAFSVLNFFATTCKKSGGLNTKLTDKQLGYVELRKVITDLKHKKYITINDHSLSFANECVRSFCNGQWLMKYVYHTLIQLNNDIQCIDDIGYNITFSRRVGDVLVKNKFDVAAIVNNKLFIIECKTKSMKDSGDDTLYKLDSLRELIGGVQSKSMLISLQPLRPSDLARSESLDVKIVAPSQLKNLKLVLLDWIESNTNQNMV